MNYVFASLDPYQYLTVVSGLPNLLKAGNISSLILGCPGPPNSFPGLIPSVFNLPFLAPPRKVSPFLVEL